MIYHYTWLIRKQTPYISSYYIISTLHHSTQMTRFTLPATQLTYCDISLMYYIVCYYLKVNPNDNNNHSIGIK